ncbi:hypothetical protein C8F01DRAFT_1116806 [Mycena amicta]|nr:hypothetical protein C8F01DRAFT_1116806 [Mycena amicta]
MAAPAPPLPPSNPRTRDWPRSEGSPLTGMGRGRGTGGRGRGRGRSRGSGNNNASSFDKPDFQPSPAPAQPPVSVSAPTPASESKERSGRPKGRKPPRPAPAVVVVESAGPSQSTESTAPTPRSSNRRRRSQQLPKPSSNPAGLKVNVPALDDNLLRPQNTRLMVPHSAPPPAKDTPPHLAGSFDIRHDINALVERVRAVAMENRPSTPGSASHIDWAGDDDEGLPDLDDWGVKTTSEKQDEMISPIIVDGLTPLPDPIVKPPTPPEVNAEQPLHPSLPSKPVSAVHVSPAKPVVTLTAPSAVAPLEKEVGLGASIHAEPASSSKLSPHVPEFNPTHQRAQTVGRTFPQPTPVNFNNRFSRSGTSTPRGGGYAARNQHARTQSSPPASGNHHSRPIITGDAISRLARTIAAPSRAPPIRTNN